ncbi:hypothetical protein GH733_009024 [Mirounga leonina]|nr:hypothetical protein GH733_009024 [Mirounga leonina]
MCTTVEAGDKSWASRTQVHPLEGPAAGCGLSGDVMECEGLWTTAVLVQRPILGEETRLRRGASACNSASVSLVKQSSINIFQCKQKTLHTGCLYCRIVTTPECQMLSIPQQGLRVHTTLTEMAYLPSKAPEAHSFGNFTSRQRLAEYDLLAT